ncbi:BatD family protein [Vibrio sp. Isolate23]|uniref:BatD family protein n=1 Tax=Vibrio sp. Isolate23 TaxID=2908533 RepID=UPI001EFD87C0|nr:BatD family protein [Vibrio sp. Isolate23]MCG9682149.1 BatD family protein [Vibrio sp. Isolate23]
MNRQIIKLISLLALAFTFVSPAALAANVWATVSKNKVVKNEVFQLRVVVDEKVSSDAIDFSALEKDFYAGRPSFGSSINIVNGDRSTRSEWNLTLAAQTLGVAKIPAFTINGASSKPIAIQVATDNDEPQISDLVELQSSLDKTTLYPNESASLRTRLIIKADPRRLQSPNVIPPRVEGLTLAQIGEPNQYQSVLDGVEVTVLDQSYRVTANQPGDYTLTGAAFKGSVVYGNDRTGTTKLISVDTPAKTFEIKVEDKPEGYTGVWLPTSQLKLTQTWTAANGEKITSSSVHDTKVGDSITREVTLDIEGLSSDRFPNLKITYPRGIRVYAEKPQFTQLNNGFTRMTLKQVLIPQQTGDVELSEVNLNWWDSQNKQQKAAHLDGLALNVSPGESLNIPVPASQYTAPAEVETITVNDPGFWPYLTGLFACLWIATTILWLKKRTPIEAPNHHDAKTSIKSSDNLIAALKAGDHFKAQHCASEWLQEAQISDKSLLFDIQTELDDMQKSRFSQQETSWNASKLLKLIKKVDKMPRIKDKPNETLAKL